MTKCWYPALINSSLYKHSVGIDLCLKVLEGPAFSNYKVLVIFHLTGTEENDMHIYVIPFIIYLGDHVNYGSYVAEKLRMCKRQFTSALHVSSDFNKDVLKNGQ